MTIKLLFMCASLEPAKCGVADFILSLAADLSAKGVSCACLAIHDSYISPSPHIFANRDTQGAIEIVRISAQYSWKEKKKLVKAQIEHFQPEWISLHYVPYAYNAKGLPFAFLDCVLPLHSLAKWELAVHEISVDPSTSLRYRILSTLQRFVFRRLCSRLKPAVVHVTNTPYQSALKQYALKAEILPLFSSIPYHPLSSPPSRPDSQWNFVLFGAINPDWQPEQLLEKIELARLAHGIHSCQFVSIGRISDYAANLWDSLHTLSYPAFTFSRLGLLPADRVSKLLQLADFGICVVPDLLIEKSVQSLPCSPTDCLSSSAG